MVEGLLRAESVAPTDSTINRFSLGNIFSNEYGLSNGQPTAKINRLGLDNAGNNSLQQRGNTSETLSFGDIYKRIDKGDALSLLKQPAELAKLYDQNVKYLDQ